MCRFKQEVVGHPVAPFLEVNRLALSVENDTLTMVSSHTKAIGKYGFG